MAISKRSMRWWSIKQRIKHVNHDVWKFTEKVCRKLLFLGDGKEFDFFEKVNEGDPYYTVNSEKLSASIEHSHIRYHGKPRREHYMDQTLRFVFLHWYQPLFTFKRWCRNKLEWYLFFKAREIEWHSHHYISRKKNDHIDGYFKYKVWGIKCGRTFDLTSLSTFKHDAMEWDTTTKKEKKVPGAYVDLNRYGKWGFPTLCVLKDKFPASDIDKVLNKWYSDQVEYKYRHWTWKGDRPKIVVTDMKFMDDLCQTCHYGSDDPDAHADWCKDKDTKNEHGTEDIPKGA